MYEVTNITTSKKKEFEWLGGYNDPPPNWKQLTEEEFILRTKFMNWNAEYIQYRQITGIGPVWLYIYEDGTGVGIASKTEYSPLKRSLVFYSFAKCVHDYKETNIGKCLTRRECKKCGRTEEVDSSD